MVLADIETFLRIIIWALKIAILVMYIILKQKKKKKPIALLAKTSDGN